MRIVVLNPNTSAATTAAMVDLARAALTADIEVEGRTAAFGSRLITDPGGLATARRAVLEMAATLPEDVGGVIVAGFGDPGLADLRKMSGRRPVVGIGEAALLEAGESGRRFSVVTTTPELQTIMAATIEALGLGSLFCSVRLAGGDPEDLMLDAERLAEGLAGAARRARDDGAEVVVIGGGPLGLVAPRVAELASVPVIEPVAAAARRLSRLVAAATEAP